MGGLIMLFKLSPEGGALLFAINWYFAKVIVVFEELSTTIMKGEDEKTIMIS